MLICDISTTHKYGKMALDTMLSPFAITWQELVVLLAFDQSFDTPQTLLSVLLQTDKENVSKLLQRMEEKHLLLRQSDLKDKRRKTYVLSPKAIEIIPLLKQTMQEWEDLCFNGLSSEEINLFINVSKVVLDNTKKIIQPSEDGTNFGDLEIE